MGNTMLIVSDGKTNGVSGTFPFPYLFLNKIVFFEHDRRKNLIPMFIFLETFMCVFFLWLIISDRNVAILTSFSIGYPAVLAMLRMMVQKKISVARKSTRIIGVAPFIFWADHVLICIAFGLGGLWANKMQDLPYFAFNIVSVFVVLAVIGAAWPFANLMVYRSRTLFIR